MWAAVGDVRRLERAYTNATADGAGVLHSPSPMSVMENVSTS